MTYICIEKLWHSCHRGTHSTLCLFYASLVETSGSGNGDSSSSIRSSSDSCSSSSSSSNSGSRTSSIFFSAAEAFSQACTAPSFLLSYLLPLNIQRRLQHPNSFVSQSLPNHSTGYFTILEPQQKDSRRIF